ncbi:hypothetical protein VT98_11713 [Candidatus Electrothrix communis]|uniref:Uncharacterized protein n=1 Tax=Candidatus Electrothrix communis TaxID=1859133 RepID=A0A3S3RUD5_9BACT|nr:hypothetical protein VT98_11713 [Candidatus Electrothrix communis]
MKKRVERLYISVQLAIESIAMLIGLIRIISVQALLLVTTKELALSLTYLRHSKRNNTKLKLILFLCTGIFFGLSWKFPQINLSILPFVLLAFLSLLIVKERLVEYRIRKGLFGTNRTETKALIDFIIKNSDDIDFNDSNGNLRRALLPEAEPATTEQTLPAFGEEASA